MITIKKLKIIDYIAVLLLLVAIVFQMYATYTIFNSNKIIKETLDVVKNLDTIPNVCNSVNTEDTDTKQISNLEETLWVDSVDGN
jgi:hypothetical protein